MINKKKLRQVIKRSMATIFNKTGAVDRCLKKGGVIILMLHKVDDKDDPLPLTITPEIFDQILTELKKRCEIVSLESLFDQMGNLIVNDNVKIAITFDDGYCDNYDHAYPILRKHDLPATIYLSYGHVEGTCSFWYEKLTFGLQGSINQSIDLQDLGSEEFSLSTPEDREYAINTLNLWLKTFTDKERLEKLDIILSRLEVEDADDKVSPMLSWDMIKEMMDNKVNFGSHTISHPILSRENRQSIEKEVVESKRLLEDKIGKEIKGFAYPNGTIDDYNETVLNFVETSEYQHACTTIPGINYRGQDPYQLKRINIDPEMCTDDDGRFIPDLFWAKVTSLI